MPRTSVDIPDPLFRRARKLARDSGRTLRDLVLDGLREVVGGRRRPRPYRMKDRSFAGDGLIEGLDWTDWERVRDLTYEGRGT
ncbi:MAG TPA: hypothetical protein VEL05_08885 [Candidatus Acidoferrum sp.]|nr:hypothetical protein [Candidatus Acidoferrum sp.]